MQSHFSTKITIYVIPEAKLKEGRAYISIPLLPTAYELCFSGILFQIIHITNCKHKCAMVKLLTVHAIYISELYRYLYMPCPPNPGE